MVPYTIREQVREPILQQVQPMTTLLYLWTVMTPMESIPKVLLITNISIL